MSLPEPLAAAAVRLRGKPGRPKKDADEGTLAERAERRLARQAAQLLAITPRLLDLDGSARYLSCSPWTVRDLIANGTIQRVVIPAANGKDLRRVLLDRQQLDDLVLRWREPTR